MKSASVLSAPSLPLRVFPLPPPDPHPTPQSELSCQAQGSWCHSAGVICYLRQGYLYFKIKRWRKQCSAGENESPVEIPGGSWPVTAPSGGRRRGHFLVPRSLPLWCLSRRRPLPVPASGVRFSHCAFFSSNLCQGRRHKSPRQPVGGSALPLASPWGPLRRKHVLSLEKERKSQSSAS